jgi:hypothetical protein
MEKIMNKIYVLDGKIGAAIPITVDCGFIIGKDVTGRTCRVAAMGVDIPERGVIHTHGKRWSRLPFRINYQGVLETTPEEK